MITGCELIYLAQRHRSQTTYNFDLLPHSPASGPSACSLMAIGLLNLLLKAADDVIEGLTLPPIQLAHPLGPDRAASVSEHGAQQLCLLPACK